MKKRNAWALLASAILFSAGSCWADSFIGGGCSDPTAATEAIVVDSGTPIGRPVGLFHRHRAQSQGGHAVSGHHGCFGGRHQGSCYGSALSYQGALSYSGAACGQGAIAAFAGSACGTSYAYSAPMMMQQPAVSAACGQYPTTPMPAPIESRPMMDCGPVASYQVVMEPKYFTETRAIPTTEYQNETRYRVRKVARQVPVEVQDYRTVTVMVPRQETKSIDYTVLVPQTGEKSVDIVDTVPVWSDVTETYTVKVPSLVDVPEEYKVRVPQLSDQEFSYTVQVPQPQTETRMQTVTNAVPVSRTRTVQTMQPVTRTQTVTKDYGHWEDRVEEVIGASTVTVPGVQEYAAGCQTAGQYSIAQPSVTYQPVCSSGPGCGGGVTASCAAPSGRHHGLLKRLFHHGGCGMGGCQSAGCGSVGGCGVSGGCGSVGGCGVSGGCGGVSMGGYDAGTCGQVIAPAVAVAPMTYSVPTTTTVTRRVWVPNVVTEEVQVVDHVPQSQEVTYTVLEQQTQQVPYDYTYVVYRPETRTGTRKVVNYVEETRTRNRKVVEYKEETRTRVRKQLSYKQQTRTETIPYVNYTTEKRTKEVAFTIQVPETKVEPFTTTRYDTVYEDVTEEYTVSVPVASSKEVQVQVCRMVPKLVPVTIYPCQSSQGTTSEGCNCGPGLIAPSPAPTVVPYQGVPTPAPCQNCTTPGCTSCQVSPSIH